MYRGYGVILPSSFTRVLPNAFGYSPSTPVSDCGTGREGRPPVAFRGRKSVELPDRAVGLAARGACTPTRRVPASPLGSLFQRGCGIINPLSVGYALGPRLRSRLTLGGLTFPRKPSAYGEGDSHSLYRYSSRHDHLDTVQASSPSPFARPSNASLPTQPFTNCVPELRFHA